MVVVREECLGANNYLLAGKKLAIRSADSIFIRTIINKLLVYISAYAHIFLSERRRLVDNRGRVLLVLRNQLCLYHRGN